MKKIAITGHTQGLGKILFNLYQKNQYEVYGASRSNGFDFNVPNNIHRFLEDIETYDILINNAPGQFQSDIFQDIYRKWQGKKKVILNVGSRTTQFSVSKAMQYGAEKAHLDFLTRSAQHFGTQYPYVLLIRPGFFGGVRSQNKEGPKVDPKYIADVIKFMIDNVENYRILDLVINK